MNTRNVIYPPPPHFTQINVNPTEVVTSAIVSLIVQSAQDPKIAELVDSFCPESTRPLSSMSLAYALASVASSLAEGDLRNAISREAERILKNAFPRSSSAKGGSD